MNFFAAQDQARKSTARLVLLFLLAVASLIFMSNVVVLVALGFINPEYFAEDDFLAQFDWYMFGMISVAIAVVILVGTVYKMLQLSQGGSAVAEMMGGTLIPADSYDLDEKKLINVVTEMAIASGTPVPAVYVMQSEHGINAFAAGYSQRDAVVAVTRGTIELLNRDELQGVIAHEFSHIFNGDMRLNIRLISILNGIMVIGMLGYFILRAAPRSRNSKGGGAAPIAAMGLGLMIVGYAGTFFGNLIKAAVSRQREYLADASAVQFTRNPSGIANALKKIGGNAYGSRVNNPGAEEISHAWFGEGVSHFMNFMMATHPPLEKRIRSIEPGWDGEFIKPEKAPPPTDAELREAQPAFNKETLFTVATVLAAQQAIDNIGQPQQQHLAFARKMLTTLPGELIEAASNTFSARAVIYFLLLAKDDATQQQQIDYLMQNADDGVAAVTLRLSSFKQQMPDEYRLSLINIALASLQQLTAMQHDRFINNIDALIKMDNRIELFEWALQAIVRYSLELKFTRKRPATARYKKFSAVADDCITLLSVLWYAGHNSAQQLDEFRDVLRSMQLEGELMARDEISLDRLNHALEKLNQLYPLQKPALLKACARVIAADAKVTAIEAELFRAIAEILDCPMPPLLADA
jgi:Zn-dependent protease with chaperone function